MAEPQATATENIPQWLGMEAPRYTSYPTAHHFAPLAEGEHAQWLSALDAQARVSAYVHIPFCHELCWFCGCHTKMTKRYEPIAAYVQLLLRELALVKQQVGGRGTLVQIHFGGGSPSLLQPDDLRAIVMTLTSLYGRTALEEVAIELDPRTTTPEMIACYAELGVNRASIGIQDFDPVVQEAINRVQPYEQVKEVFEQLRQAGIDHLNADLIYGLPHQSARRFADTLVKTLMLSPDRIALFSYAHVPQIKKHQRLIDTHALPAEQEKLQLFAMACEVLEANGYVAIGMDHFAKADDPLAVAMQQRGLRRNFQGYVTDDTEALMGFGCSAISQFPQGYVQNSASMPVYQEQVVQGALPSVRGKAFAGDDQARKQVIDTLMCEMAVDLSAVRARWALPEGYFDAELKRLDAASYRAIVSVEGEQLRLTTPYRMAVRVVAAVFDGYQGVAAGRYSKVA